MILWFHSIIGVSIIDHHHSAYHILSSLYSTAHKESVWTLNNGTTIMAMPEHSVEMHMNVDLFDFLGDQKVLPCPYVPTSLEEKRTT